MLQADLPPKAVKVTMSKRVPLVGEELIAYEEEQNRIKKEEALKASLIKEEETKASYAADAKIKDPMDIDLASAHTSKDGTVFLLSDKQIFLVLFSSAKLYKDNFGHKMNSLGVSLCGCFPHQ